MAKNSFRSLVQQNMTLHLCTKAFNLYCLWNFIHNTINFVFWKKKTTASRQLWYLFTKQLAHLAAQRWVTSHHTRLLKTGRLTFSAGKLVQFAGGTNNSNREQFTSGWMVSEENRHLRNNLVLFGCGRLSYLCVLGASHCVHSNYFCLCVCQ